jgi:hypothetical protein
VGNCCTFPGTRVRQYLLYFPRYKSEWVIVLSQVQEWVSNHSYTWESVTITHSLLYLGKYNNYSLTLVPGKVQQLLTHSCTWERTTTHPLLYLRKYNNYSLTLYLGKYNNYSLTLIPGKVQQLLTHCCTWENTKIRNMYRRLLLYTDGFFTSPAWAWPWPLGMVSSSTLYLVATKTSIHRHISTSHISLPSSDQYFIVSCLH